MKIQGREVWTLSERLGGGGFGQVFRAVSDDGQLAAANLVPKAPGAERELLFEQLSDVPNVVPIIDTAETVDAWALVMPLAERSLAEEIAQRGPLPLDQALVVLIDIATALAALEGNVVHRDLKPQNVLLLAGRWCLADFGIARYAEASTAPDTRKFAMSMRYAAPERWRGERATAAADVYSLGVMVHEVARSNRAVADVAAEYGSPGGRCTGPWWRQRQRYSQRLSYADTSTWSRRAGWCATRHDLKDWFVFLGG